eukprot:8782529-Lingulodinium_polyedra.AAC.1
MSGASCSRRVPVSPRAGRSERARHPGIGDARACAARGTPSGHAVAPTRAKLLVARARCVVVVARRLRRI